VVSLVAKGRRFLAVALVSPLGFAALAALALGSALLSIDAPVGARSTKPAAGPPRDLSACEGGRADLPRALFYDLRGGAFPGLGHPDVAVHVPARFDATRSPGLVVYLHGWNGCVAAALSADDSACADGGLPRPGADLASQVDDAGVNALLVAIEVRVDMPSGEPGQLAMPGGLRDLLRELFSDHLAGALGCALTVDALDRAVVIAHSGGYQAAASVLSLGDVPRITEVDLLDALYGADDVFADWIKARSARFDPRVEGGVRFVDLYTCCGGTVAGSRALARIAGDTLAAARLGGAFYDDDGDRDVDTDALAHSIVFKRVPREHAAMPGAYVRPLLEAAGFARIAAPTGSLSHSLRPK
jgi:hypothetical protein